jgi:peptidase E
VAIDLNTGGYVVNSFIRRSNKVRQAAVVAAFCAFAALMGGLSSLKASDEQEKPQPAVKRQILAIGGGGGDPMMQYFLDMTGKKTPRICYMPTATGDPKSAIDSWLKKMEKFDCVPKVQKMFIASPNIKSFEDELLAADAIYVGGGNTLNMIAIWKAQGVDKILRKAYDKGTVLGGGSAGAICWFEQGSTDSRPGKLTPMDCLGFLKGSNVPHYDGEKKRRPLYHDWILKGEIKEGIACDNSAGAHFINEELHKVVSSNAKGKAYRVFKQGDKVVEEVIKAEMLKKKGK